MAEEAPQRISSRTCRKALMTTAGQVRLCPVPQQPCRTSVVSQVSAPSDFVEPSPSILAEKLNFHLRLSLLYRPAVLFLHWGLGFIWKLFHRNASLDGA